MERVLIVIERDGVVSAYTEPGSSVDVRIIAWPPGVGESRFERSIPPSHRGLFWPGGSFLAAQGEVDARPVEYRRDAAAIFALCERA